MLKNVKGKRNRSLIPHSKIVELYLAKNPTTKIARSAGISVAGVFRILRYNQVPMRTKAESEFLKRRYDYEAIAKDYKNGMFLRDVAKKYGLHASTALHIIKNTGGVSR